LKDFEKKFAEEYLEIEEKKMGETVEARLKANSEK
jgi:hypothetical protein